ncbi:MAG: HAD hydrolase family protein [Clostridiales bacterium]|nr:HAD hydrolase family protein [Clostridiales bacterium]
MDKKMFFLDLDGTTLRDDKTIPEENITAIREAADRGHYVAIATGRSTVSALPIAKQLGMLRKGCFLISYNGTKILTLENMEMLRELFLPVEDAAYLFAEAERYRVHVQAYGGDEILARRESPELDFYANQSKMEYRIIPGLYASQLNMGCRMVPGLYAAGELPSRMLSKDVSESEMMPESYESKEAVSVATPKVLLASLKDRALLEKFREDHREWESGRCVSFFSAPEYLEYCPLHGTKADGIVFFENYLGIAHENTVAMGDEENDLAMIRAAGVGVAMPNAAESIRRCADFVPEHDNNTAGVAEVIRQFLEL